MARGTGRTTGWKLNNPGPSIPDNHDWDVGRSFPPYRANLQDRVRLRGRSTTPPRECWSPGILFLLFSFLIFVSFFLFAFFALFFLFFSFSHDRMCCDVTHTWHNHFQHWPSILEMNFNLVFKKTDRCNHTWPSKWISSMMTSPTWWSIISKQKLHQAHDFLRYRFYIGSGLPLPIIWRVRTKSNHKKGNKKKKKKKQEKEKAEPTHTIPFFWRSDQNVCLKIHAAIPIRTRQTHNSHHAHNKHIKNFTHAHLLQTLPIGCSISCQLHDHFVQFASDWISLTRAPRSEKY